MSLDFRLSKLRLIDCCEMEMYTDINLRIGVRCFTNTHLYDKEDDVTHKTMLAHIVPKLTNQGENTATDALLYLLWKYPIASKAFISYVSKLGTPLSDKLKFNAQIGLAGRAIPDIIGTDENNQLMLVVESKFWAPLTEKQPVVYLNHLPSGGEGVLLFIAPSSRFPTLWRELFQRCKDNGLSVDKAIVQPDGCCVAKIDSVKMLGMVSWESVLSFLRQELESNGVIEGVYEVSQLEGLCERLDGEALHPLQIQDIQPGSDIRIEHYHTLVNDLVGILIEKGYASTKGYRRTSNADYYKRYTTLFGIVNWCIEYNGVHWTDFQTTPIWLSVHSTSHPIERLNPLRAEIPSRLFEDKGRIIIPLKLPLGVERDVILKSLVQQIEDFKELIKA